MSLNTGKLAGKTAYITGASRGIGKAIALKLAKDGANIVIAAKTAVANPQLPGTIYTAAEEIVAAGGKCLPCVVDIRDENAVLDSVAKTVKEFGGIDILVNNASAISLTGTLETSMKKYDLMNSINARGTYLCSQACLPYLKKSKNPHILNISPPLSMKSIWFKNHSAYTIAKYGMSMCVLGMSEEFKKDGIAVNALWPRTTVATAAVNMLGGDKLMKTSRKPDIMADAAYVILTKHSGSYTGNFAIDDDVLKEVGISDKELENYSYVPGSKLTLDYFVDGAESFFMGMGTKKKAPSSSSSLSTKSLFNKMQTLINPTIIQDVQAIFKFELSGKEPGTWIVDLKNGSGSIVENPSNAVEATCTLVISSEDFAKMVSGELNSMQAFMNGTLKIKGNMAEALKLEKLMKSLNKSKL
ncbi:hydroxysteroid dehydrogenase-like protein 2 [Hydra vulgaris]|uniref:Hydroxysteroid dehydrogenase-like protein 2 n=1 Tax=Hydra vulgaris TaxID=6087 RepID=T2MB56_HYDVU|nr:hydroxysteroid dehydrogenase-like protein 2 [Hydra vulgaris]